MTLKAGIIGCGNIARFHLSGLKKAEAEIAWACDLDEERATAFAGRCGARPTADFRDLLSGPGVDMVLVTTASPAHKTICLAAIDAGKAVICEKTLATNPDDARDIVRAATDRGTIFYTSYMKRFIPAMQKARELLPSIGPVISTWMRTCQCWGDLWSSAPPDGFFHTPPGGQSPVVKAFGGGILVCGGSHILDLVCFLHGRPHRLYAHMQIPEERDYDLQAAVLMETANGPVHFEALAHPLTRIGFLRDGWDERVEITGVRGSLEILSASWDEVETKASLLRHYDSATGNLTEYRYDPESPFERAERFFCANIARGEQGEQPRTTGYDVDELIAHIRTSAAQGQARTINWRL